MAHIEDPDRVRSVATLRLDETALLRVGRWRHRLWPTQLVGDRDYGVQLAGPLQFEVCRMTRLRLATGERQALAAYDSRTRGGFWVESMRDGSKILNDLRLEGGLSMPTPKQVKCPQPKCGKWVKVFPGKTVVCKNGHVIYG